MELKFSRLIFSTVRINGILEVNFYIRIPKSLIYKSFASLCCVNLEATPISYLQDTVLNLPNPYLEVLPYFLIVLAMLKNTW